MYLYKYFVFESILAAYPSPLKGMYNSTYKSPYLSFFFSTMRSQIREIFSIFISWTSWPLTRFSRIPSLHACTSINVHTETPLYIALDITCVCACIYMYIWSRSITWHCVHRVLISIHCKIGPQLYNFCDITHMYYATRCVIIPLTTTGLLTILRTFL